MVLSTLQTLSLGVGVIYYILSLQNTRKNQQLTLETRQAQLFMQLMDKAYSKEGIDFVGVLSRATWSSYEEWLLLRRDDLEYNTAYLWLSQNYGCIGAFVRLGYTDIKLLAHCMPRDHLGWWESLRDVIYERRKRLNNRSYHSEWEYLYNELVKYLEEHPELEP